MSGIVIGALNLLGSIIAMVGPTVLADVQGSSDLTVDGAAVLKQLQATEAADRTAVDALTATAVPDAASTPKT